jgi:chromosome segregation ATPase
MMQEETHIVSHETGCNRAVPIDKVEERLTCLTRAMETFLFTLQELKSQTMAKSDQMQTLCLDLRTSKENVEARYDDIDSRLKEMDQAITELKVHFWSLLTVRSSTILMMCYDRVCRELERVC